MFMKKKIRIFRQIRKATGFFIDIYRFTYILGNGLSFIDFCLTILLSSKMNQYLSNSMLSVQMLGRPLVFLSFLCMSSFSSLGTLSHINKYFAFH